MELRNGLHYEDIPASGNEETIDEPPITSAWRAEINGRIPCPPKARGGCGTSILSLRRLFEANWVNKLVRNAEELTIQYHPPSVDLLVGCLQCHRFVVDLAQNSVRKAASRETNHDNFLYCPDAVDMGDTEYEHFQRHWIRGEPVIVRNVFEKASGLSWHPMVMWRAFRGANKILKEEPTTFKAIDCLDWCEVHALFFRLSLPLLFILIKHIMSGMIVSHILACLFVPFLSFLFFFVFVFAFQFSFMYFYYLILFFLLCFFIVLQFSSILIFL